MCGRFVSSSPPDELASYFGATTPSETLGGPNYNVAPTSDVYVVYEDGDTRRLEAFHWGLVPFWAKDLSVGSRMINARAEGLATKSAFRRPFAERRCIVPADGFYEWAKVPGHRKKQPYYIHRVDGEPLAFAGLWEVWRDPAGAAADGQGRAAAAPWVRSCTIVTTDANEVLADLHDRMPVVLPPSAWADWLDPDNHDTAALGRLLVPAPAGLVTYHPVSTEVGNASNQGEHLIEPVAEIDPDGKRAGQASLLDEVPGPPAPGAEA